MTKAAKQEILGMSLPLDMCARREVTLFELRHGNLHHSERYLVRGETITVEEIANHGNCQEVFMAAKIRLDGKIYWAAVGELKQFAFAKVA